MSREEQLQVEWFITILTKEKSINYALYDDTEVFFPGNKKGCRDLVLRENGILSKVEKLYVSSKYLLLYCSHG